MVKPKLIPYNWNHHSISNIQSINLWSLFGHSMTKHYIIQNVNLFMHMLEFPCYYSTNTLVVQIICMDILPPFLAQQSILSPFVPFSSFMIGIDKERT